jgi:hypothetical protein
MARERHSRRGNAGTEGSGAQCERCCHGQRNRGLIVSAEATPYFCRLSEEVRDPAASILIGGLLTAAAAEGRCPHFEAPEYGPDAYRSRELEHGRR